MKHTTTQPGRWGSVVNQRLASCLGGEVRSRLMLVSEHRGNSFAVASLFDKAVGTECSRAGSGNEK